MILCSGLLVTQSVIHIHKNYVNKQIDRGNPNGIQTKTNALISITQVSYIMKGRSNVATENKYVMLSL